MHLTKDIFISSLLLGLLSFAAVGQDNDNQISPSEPTISIYGFEYEPGTFPTLVKEAFKKSPKYLLNALTAAYEKVPSWDRLEPWQQSQIISLIISIATVIAVKYFGGSYGLLSKLVSMMGLDADQFGPHPVTFQFIPMEENPTNPLTKTLFRDPLGVTGIKKGNIDFSKLALLGGFTISKIAVERAMSYLMVILTLIPTLAQIGDYSLTQVKSLISQLGDYFWSSNLTDETAEPVRPILFL
jgi:hypothetical protein